MALTSAPNSHGACHDLALGPVPTQNARLEERGGCSSDARARSGDPFPRSHRTTVFPALTDDD